MAAMLSSKARFSERKRFLKLSTLKYQNFQKYDMSHQLGIDWHSEGKPASRTPLLINIANSTSADLRVYILTPQPFSSDKLRSASNREPKMLKRSNETLLPEIEHWEIANWATLFSNVTWNYVRVHILVTKMRKQFAAAWEWLLKYWLESRRPCHHQLLPRLGIGVSLSLMLAGRIAPTSDLPTG